MNNKIRARNGVVSGRVFAVIAAGAFAIAGLAARPAMAAGPVSKSCRTIRLASAAWTDNTVQNAVFSAITTPLGYRVKTNVYSVPVIFRGMKNNQIDLFLDNWMPAEAATRKHYLEQKAIDVVRADLTGAKYTLVVPAYLYKEGLKSFSDIHKFAGRLHHRIYGIDPGSGGNVLIEKMLKAKAFDLGDFHLVQSSSAGMLAEVKRRYDKKQAIVFLGWEPHPMNIEFDIKYLSGGAKYFGPHQGAATVYIVTRHGYAQDCPNLGALLNNFRLDVHAENKMMYAIQVKGEKPAAVARTWLAAHPAWIKTTLDGVTTTDGKPAAAAAPAASGQG